MAYAFDRNVPNDFGFHVIIAEWTVGDADTPDWLVVGPFSDIVVQLMAITAGTPTIGIDCSLNRPDDGSIVSFRGTDPTQTTIAMAAAGGKAVLESPYIIRPRVVSGTGEARVRIKASKMIAGF